MKTIFRLAAAAPIAACLAAHPATAASLSTVPFGTTADGTPVSLTTMTSAHGVVVKFMSYGGIITEIDAPDRRGRLADIVLGFPTLRDYETESADGQLYFGALVGRYANRIAKGHFSLDGHSYTLAVNDPPNALHGGLQGFDKRVWSVQPLVGTGTNTGTSVSAVLRLTSPDGDQGYPGTMQVAVTYSLDDENGFTIHYQATTNKDTVLNLTNHSYFNLAGAGSPDGVFQQILTVDADQYTPTDQTSIPLGRNCAGAGHAVRFPHPDRNRRAYSQRRPAADLRAGLRSQLGAQQDRRSGPSATGRNRL